MPRIKSRVPQVLAVIEQRADKRRDEIVASSKRALALSLREGAILLQDLLEQAETTTGRERASAGGISSGRHETGNMVASISHNADRLQLRAKQVIGSFGWFKDEYEEYFHYQDLGTVKIPAANAMEQAAAYAASRFEVRMIHIMQGHPEE